MTQADIGQIQEGWDVYGSDGQEIGDVNEIGPNYFVVQKGWLFTKDVYVPHSAVRRIGNERIELNITKDEVTQAGWDQPPAEGYGQTGYAEGAYTAQAGAAESTYATDDALTATQTTSTGYADTEPAGQYYEGEVPRTRDTTVSDSATIERREEQLQAGTRAERAGEVRVRKDVVEEQQTVDVPVMREEVEVRSRAVDRPAEGGAFEREEVNVPLTEERVEVRKEPRVVEEVEIGKTARQDVERVTDTVRKERVDIADESNTDIDRRG